MPRLSTDGGLLPTAPQILMGYMKDLTEEFRNRTNFKEKDTVFFHEGGFCYRWKQALEQRADDAYKAIKSRQHTMTDECDQANILLQDLVSAPQPAYKTIITKLEELKKSIKDIELQLCANKKALYNPSIKNNLTQSEAEQRLKRLRASLAEKQIKKQQIETAKHIYCSIAQIMQQSLSEHREIFDLPEFFNNQFSVDPSRQ